MSNLGNLIADLQQGSNVSKNLTVNSLATATTGGTQTTSYNIVTGFTFVTSATLNAGVTLPLITTNLVGSTFYIYNGSGNAINIYPNVNQSIDDTPVHNLGTNNPFNETNGIGYQFLALNPTTWLILNRFVA